MVSIAGGIWVVLLVDKNSRMARIQVRDQLEAELGYEDLPTFAGDVDAQQVLARARRKAQEEREAEASRHAAGG